MILRDPNISLEYRTALAMSTAFQPALPTLLGWFRTKPWFVCPEAYTPGPVTGRRG